MIIASTLLQDDLVDSAAPGTRAMNSLVGSHTRATIPLPSSNPLPARRARPATGCVTSQVLAVQGYPELTAATCKAFRTEVCAALKGQTEVEIDLSATTVIDCAGLGALLAIRNAIRGQGGVVRLLNPTAQVQQLLKLTRAAQMFEIGAVAQPAAPEAAPRKWAFSARRPRFLNPHSGDCIINWQEPMPA